MKRSLILLVCFVVLVLGIVNLILFLVGMQISIFSWVNHTLGGKAPLVYVGMILIASIVIYLSNTTTRIPEDVKVG